MFLHELTHQHIIHKNSFNTHIYEYIYWTFRYVLIFSSSKSIHIPPFNYYSPRTSLIKPHFTNKPQFLKYSRVEVDLYTTSILLRIVSKVWIIIDSISFISVHSGSFISLANTNLKIFDTSK